MRTIIISLSFALACSTLGSAQSVLSSQYPVGLPLLHSTGSSQSFGGNGVGVMNETFGMADNPANLAGFGRASFSSFMSVDYTGFNQNGAASGALGFSPQLFSFGFPLATVGTFCFSFDRRSALNFKYRKDSTIVLPIGNDLIDLGIARSGGLSSWQAGWGRTFGKYLHIGIAYERLYLAGSEIFQQQTSSTIPGQIATFFRDSTAISFSGNGFRLGVLAPIHDFTIGIAGEYVFSGDLTKEVRGDHYAAPVSRIGSLQMPPSLSLGASWQISPQWLTSAGLGMTLWQEYSSGVTMGLPVDNALSFSCGGQFIPAPNLLMPRYWEIIQYRAGLRYSQLPVATASEMAATISLGLPVQAGGGLFDIIFEIGRRSDSAIPDFSENVFKIGLGINGGSKWFQSTGTRY